MAPRRADGTIAFRQGIGQVEGVDSEVFWALAILVESDDVTFQPGPYFCDLHEPYSLRGQRAVHLTIDLFEEFAEAAVSHGSSICQADDLDCPELLRVAAGVGQSNEETTVS